MSLAQIGQRYHNDFQHDAIIIGNRRQTGLRIVCSARKDNCIKEQTVKLGNGSSTCEQTFANKLFGNKGWQLGKDRRHDVCPMCAAHKQEHPPKILPAMPQQQLQLEAPPAPVAAAPLAANDQSTGRRFYSQSDKKFIIDYTREVMDYDNDRELWSYKTGWNDDKVAKELHTMFPSLSGWTVRQLRNAHIGFTRNRRTKAEMRQAKIAPKAPVVKVINNPIPSGPAAIPPEFLEMLTDLKEIIGKQQVQLERQQIILDRLTADRKQQVELNQQMVQRMNELAEDLDQLGADFDAFNEVKA